MRDFLVYVIIIDTGTYYICDEISRLNSFFTVSILGSVEAVRALYMPEHGRLSHFDVYLKLLNRFNKIYWYDGP